MISCYYLIIGPMSITPKHVVCGRFSVLHVRKISNINIANQSE